MYNKYGSKFTIVEYISCKKVMVETKEGYKYLTTYKKFLNKQLNNKYDKTVFDVGFLGNSKTKENNKFKRAYTTWFQMMRRCYDKKWQLDKPSYVGCFVCDEWLCFEHFEKWFDKNYWELENEEMSLDKDILKYGNKKYSPTTCIFVPKRINNTFSNMYSKGVTFHKNRYIARTIGHNVGSFDNEIEANIEYKKAKMFYIKQLAEEYKLKYPNFPKRLYDAMYNYNII